MRVWPRFRAASIEPPAAPPEDLLVTEELLRRNVEDIFRVEERQIRGYAVIFGGDLLISPQRALALLEPRFKPFGYTPFLRTDRGKTWIQAFPLAEVTETPRIRLNVLLFALTCLSTLIAGASFSGSPTFDGFRSSLVGTLFLSGVPFASTLMAILVVHEFGHYFTARRYSAAVSLPYFIPAPPPLFPFGTLGAIIKMKSPARDRNSLFDIAAAGPLSGLVVALVALAVGLEWSRIGPASDGYLIFGRSLLWAWFLNIWFGPIPGGMMVHTHPVADAAWVGLFVTALNLFPVGQLDGGRIAYALFGGHHRKIAFATVGTLLAMGAITQSLNWFVWAALLLFVIGFQHAPPMDDLTPISPGRRILGGVCLVLLVLLTPPVPVQVQ